MKKGKEEDYIKFLGKKERLGIIWEYAGTILGISFVE